MSGITARIVWRALLRQAHSLSICEATPGWTVYLAMVIDAGMLRHAHLRECGLKMARGRFRPKDATTDPSVARNGQDCKRFLTASDSALPST